MQEKFYLDVMQALLKRFGTGHLIRSISVADQLVSQK